MMFLKLDFVVTGAILVSLPSICLQDQSLAQTSFSEELAAGNVAKPWIVYIKMNSFKTLTMQGKAAKSHTSSLFSLEREALCFVKYAKKVVKKRYKPGRNQKFNRTIISPTIDMHMEWLWFVVGSVWVLPTKYVFLFCTTPQQKLNMTFLSINFRKLRETCKLCNLTVVSQSSTNFSETFTFCGILSTLSLYPPSSSVQILPNLVSISAMMRAFVTVIARNVVESRIKNNEATNMDTIFYIKFAKLWIVTHRLRLRKDLTVDLWLNVSATHQHRMFDGPGPRSAQVSKHVTNKTFHASSFQCVVQIESRNTLLDDSVITYKGRNLPGRSVLVGESHNQTETVQYNTTAKLSALFLLALVNTAGTNNNITLDHFYFNGQQNTDCIFGGIVVIESTNQTPIETMLLCNKGTHNFTVNMSVPFSIYTRNASKIVVYSYKDYSWMSLAVRVSHTSCRTTTINPCELHRIPRYTYGSFEIGVGLSFYRHKNWEGITANLTNLTCAVLEMSTNRWMDMEEDETEETGPQLLCSVDLLLKSKSFETSPLCVVYLRTARVSHSSKSSSHCKRCTDNLPLWDQGGQEKRWGYILVQSTGDSNQGCQLKQRA